jgi:hypothetical protein
MCSSVADPGCFIPEPNIFHFSIPDPNSFHPGSYIKRGVKNKNYLFSCCLWFQEQVLLVKKIIHPGSGSVIQGVKKSGYRVWIRNTDVQT